MEPIECSVCRSPCYLPTKLECNHVFCYLCAKGASNFNGKCPLCRRDISEQTLKKPKLTTQDVSLNTNSSDEIWFYEGKKSSGWWCYDNLTNQIIESAFQSGEKSCEVMISGFIYTIDFENKTQIRNDEPFRKRKIRRDKIQNINSNKGIAGVSKQYISSNLSDNTTVDNVNTSNSDDNQNQNNTQQEVQNSVTNQVNSDQVDSDQVNNDEAKNEVKNEQIEEITLD